MSMSLFIVCLLLLQFFFCSPIAQEVYSTEHNGEVTVKHSLVGENSSGNFENCGSDQSHADFLLNVRKFINL